MGFADDINRFAVKAVNNCDQLTRLTVMKIGEKLIKRTPVGDAKYWQSGYWTKGGRSGAMIFNQRNPPPGYTGGHARANWHYSGGVQIVQEIEGIDKSGADTQSRINQEIPVKAGGKVHFIQNSVPYIERLEDGWSRQAPNGMVSLTAAEFQGIISEEASKLK